jgi:hypothetical protein
LKHSAVKSEKKVCGNCRYHNTYDYPSQIFCFVKFQKRDNPVVSTLGHCDEWEYKEQECFCLEDTLKRNKKKP